MKSHGSQGTALREVSCPEGLLRSKIGTIQAKGEELYHIARRIDHVLAAIYGENVDVPGNGSEPRPAPMSILDTLDMAIDDFSDFVCYTGAIAEKLERLV